MTTSWCTTYYLYLEIVLSTNAVAHVSMNHSHLTAWSDVALHWHKKQSDKTLIFCHVTTTSQTTTCFEASHEDFSIIRSEESPAHYLSFFDSMWPLHELLVNMWVIFFKFSHLWQIQMYVWWNIDFFLVRVAPHLLNSLCYNQSYKSAIFFNQNSYPIKHGQGHYLSKLHVSLPSSGEKQDFE